MKKVNKFLNDEYIGGEQSNTDVTNELRARGAQTTTSQSSYIPDALCRLQSENVTDWRE